MHSGGTEAPFLANDYRLLAFRDTDNLRLTLPPIASFPVIIKFKGTVRLLEIDRSSEYDFDGTCFSSVGASVRSNVNRTEWTTGTICEHSYTQKRYEQTYRNHHAE